MVRLWFAAFTIILVELLKGCGSPTPKTDVVATTGMIADAVRNITKGKLRVECLMGPGVDPHKFTPAPSDLEKLSGAKLVFYNGLHLEGKMVDVLEKPLPGQRAMAVSAKLDHKKLRKADADGAEHDPHVWFDVKLWIQCVETIRDELCTSFPEYEEEFRKNAAEYLKELSALDAEVRMKAESLPPEKRVLVTSHDAFGYFGDAYGFEVHGLQGVSTAAASDTSSVESLAQLIINKKVSAIFTETSVPTQGLQQVMGTLKAKKACEVRLIGDQDSLYSDALGAKGTPGESYIGMVRHNIDVIVKFLK